MKLVVASFFAIVLCYSFITYEGDKAVKTHHESIESGSDLYLQKSVEKVDSTEVLLSNYDMQSNIFRNYKKAL